MRLALIPLIVLSLKFSRVTAGAPSAPSRVTALRILLFICGWCPLVAPRRSPATFTRVARHLGEYGEDVFDNTLVLVNRNGPCAARRCETEDPKRHAYNDFTVPTPLLSARTHKRDQNGCTTQGCATDPQLAADSPSVSRRCPESTIIRASISHMLHYTPWQDKKRVLCIVHDLIDGSPRGSIVLSRQFRTAAPKTILRTGDRTNFSREEYLFSF